MGIACVCLDLAFYQSHKLINAILFFDEYITTNRAACMAFTIFSIKGLVGVICMMISTHD